MPLVEFAGVSGVGKTTLLNRLFQFEKLQRWNPNIGSIPIAREVYSDTGDVLTGTRLKLWQTKVRHVSERAETEAMKSFHLGIASWHLRWDQGFPHHHAGPFSAIDEHFLQLLFPELCWLVQLQTADAKIFLQSRNFILLTDDPQHILERVRQRQVTGPRRPHLEGCDDAKILTDSERFQAAMLAFLQAHEDFGYSWLVIDMSKGFDAALSQAMAFMLGLENIQKASATPDEA